jgi:hypothetical protein
MSAIADTRGVTDSEKVSKQYLSTVPYISISNLCFGKNVKENVPDKTLGWKVPDKTIGRKVPADKRLVKEAQRSTLLANSITLKTNTVDKVEFTALQNKAKQSVVNKILKPAKNKRPKTVVAKNKKKAVTVKPKAKRQTGINKITNKQRPVPAWVALGDFRSTTRTALLSILGMTATAIDVMSKVLEGSISHTITSPINTVETVQWSSLSKAKQTTINILLHKVNQTLPNTVMANNSEKAAPVQARKERPSGAKKKTKKKKTTPTVMAVPGINNIQEPIVERSIIQLCGCRHGDLNAMKCFTKAEVAFYIQPRKFLEGRGCLDCNDAVRTMTSTGTSQKAVVYFCDEGIKGFDAPHDNPMKSELTCALVLCPQCEAKRRITFEKESAGRPRSGRKRKKQQMGSP